MRLRTALTLPLRMGAPRTLERAPGGPVPPSVLTWLETQPGCGAALLTNRTVRNHLGKYSPEAWPEVRKERNAQLHAACSKVK